MLDLGQKIKKIRELRGFSQEYMAVKLKVSQEQYSYIETKQKNIPLPQKEEIAKLLGVSIDFLENFDLQNIFTNNFNDHSQGYFNIDNLIIQGYENERKAHLELIQMLREEVYKLTTKVKE